MPRPLLERNRAQGLSWIDPWAAEPSRRILNGYELRGTMDGIYRRHPARLIHQPIARTPLSRLERSSTALPRPAHNRRTSRFHGGRLPRTCGQEGPATLSRALLTVSRARRHRLVNIRHHTTTPPRVKALPSGLPIGERGCESGRSSLPDGVRPGRRGSSLALRDQVLALGKIIRFRKR